MNKNLLIVIFFAATLLSADFCFAQEQIINKSALSNDNALVMNKIAFIDSVRKANILKQQQDNIYFKSLHEQGYSRQHIDSLHKTADPNFIFPAWYPPSDEVRLQQISPNANSALKNYSPPPSALSTQPEQDCINGIAVCMIGFAQQNANANNNRPAPHAMKQVPIPQERVQAAIQRRNSIKPVDTALPGEKQQGGNGEQKTEQKKDAIVPASPKDEKQQPK